MQVFIFLFSDFFSWIVRMWCRPCFAPSALTCKPEGRPFTPTGGSSSSIFPTAVCQRLSRTSSSRLDNLSGTFPQRGLCNQGCFNWNKNNGLGNSSLWFLLRLLALFAAFFPLSSWLRIEWPCKTSLPVTNSHECCENAVLTNNLLLFIYFFKEKEKTLTVSSWTRSCLDSLMGNVIWRGQASSEDTDSSLQGDLDEDTGTDIPSLAAHTRSFKCNSAGFLRYGDKWLKLYLVCY